MPIYMTILRESETRPPTPPVIRGDVTAAGYKDWIEIKSLSFNLARSDAAGGGAGSGGGSATTTTGGTGTTARSGTGSRSDGGFESLRDMFRQYITGELGREQDRARRAHLTNMNRVLTNMRAPQSAAGTDRAVTSAERKLQSGAVRWNPPPAATAGSSGAASGSDWFRQAAKIESVNVSKTLDRSSPDLLHWATHETVRAVEDPDTKMKVYIDVCVAAYGGNRFYETQTTDTPPKPIMTSPLLIYDLHECVLTSHSIKASSGEEYPEETLVLTPTKELYTAFWNRNERNEWVVAAGVTVSASSPEESAPDEGL